MYVSHIILQLCHPPRPVFRGETVAETRSQCPDLDPRVEIVPPQGVTESAPTVRLMYWQVHRMALSCW